MKRLAVLASGNGSNLQAILDAVRDKRLCASIELVVSDNACAYALERARLAAVPAVYFPYPARKDGDEARRRRDSELADLLARHSIDYVVLAGWMRLLTAPFLDRFPLRVVNLHPALPGHFPGPHAIERAYEGFRDGRITHTGVMVHRVPDEGVDSGPLILERFIPIFGTDDLASLTARVHEVEHCVLIEALAMLLDDPD